MAVPELHYRDPGSGNLIAYHDPDKLSLAGGTVTGYVKIAHPGSLGFNSATVQNHNVEFLTGDKLRWTLGKTNAAETGSNAGSNFSFSAWDDAGAWLHNVATFDRATGLITVKGDPTAPLGIATKQWVETNAGGKRVVTVISTSQTAGSAAKTDYVYICSAALTLTLPTAVGNGNMYTVKRSGTGTVTLATTSSQTIDGLTTYPINKQWASVDIVSDGANWVVTNPNEIEVGTVQPTDNAVELWVDPSAVPPAAGVDTSWKSLSLLNGWALYAAPWGVAKYRKTPGNMVHVQFMIQGGGSSRVAVLPAGYRPATNLIIAARATDRACECRIYTADGGIDPAGVDYVSSGWFSLVTSFYADA